MTVYSTSMTCGPNGPYIPVVVFDGHCYKSTKNFSSEIEAKKHAAQILDIVLAKAKHNILSMGFKP